MIRDKTYLNLIRMLPCVAGGQGRIEACHIRKGNDGGMGIKPSDCFVLPLSSEKHSEQHRVGEVTFWGGLDNVYRASEIAKELYNARNDVFLCQRIVMNARKELFNERD